jgi:8-oxo-dGTP diphosphatase
MPHNPPETPKICVDVAVFDERSRLLLIERRNEPFKGEYALPGGFMDIGETAEAAARRELKEETGIKAGRLYLAGVYSDPGRDPRGHNISIAFASIIRATKPKAGDDAASAVWVKDWMQLDLAFDHGQIARDAALLLLSATSEPRGGQQ